MAVVKFLVTWGLFILALRAGIDLLGFDQASIVYGLAVGVFIMAIRTVWDEMSEG